MQLQAESVGATIQRLHARMLLRFPERRITALAEALEALERDVAEVTVESRQRLRWVRALTRVVMVVVVVATVVALYLTLASTTEEGPTRRFEWLPLIESTINDVVFAAIAVFFLYALPNRLERGRMLRVLHRLRSLAHIVDMHQLTKDPERLRPDFQATPNSPDLNLTRDELQHYLEYCSELFSLIGKVAALCAEASEDAVVLDTVSTVEDLTTGLSNKVWQKISLLPRA